MASPLITVEELADPPTDTILDVRWQLTTGAQPNLYASGHIPGAAFVDLDRDLAAPPGRQGRHPLPATEEFAAGVLAAGLVAGLAAGLAADFRLSGAGAGPSIT